MSGAWEMYGISNMPRFQASQFIVVFVVYCPRHRMTLDGEVGDANSSCKSLLLLVGHPNGIIAINAEDIGVDPCHQERVVPGRHVEVGSVHQGYVGWDGLWVAVGVGDDDAGNIEIDSLDADLEPVANVKAVDGGVLIGERTLGRHT